MVRLELTYNIMLFETWWGMGQVWLVSFSEGEALSSNKIKPDRSLATQEGLCYANLCVFRTTVCRHVRSTYFPVLHKSILAQTTSRQTSTWFLPNQRTNRGLKTGLLYPIPPPSTSFQLLPFHRGST